MKNLITILSLIVFAINLSAQNIQDIEFGTDDTFEVVSWNIEWFPTNGQTTLNYVKQVIEAVDADVFAVQEIDDKDMFRQIGEDLDAYESYIPDGEYSSLGYIYKSGAIEFVEIYKIYETSQYWKAFPRAPLVFELKFNGQKYYVIDNHFKCCGDGDLEQGNEDDEENRRFEAMNLLKQYIDNDLTNERVLVVGDMNDVLTDNSSDNVFQNVIDDSENYLFTDMEIAQGSSSNYS
ncbi:MAG: endonuclease/exonuclease/phosphatase family protein [Salinivirgaceae bacterium]|nr:endonuclease/exonuclease/phosphatase family protein [Salinivirgaceae bacterium]